MTITGALCLVMALGSLAFGERVSFDTRAAWQEWAHPVGAVDLQATGRIQPVPIRKNINAVRNAERFGGGIHRVGSNTRDPCLVMDGDPTDGIEHHQATPASSWTATRPTALSIIMINPMEAHHDTT